MVAVVGSPLDNRNSANVGMGFDGVVRVVAGNNYGTGVLLWDGRHILTAAHIALAASAITAYFQTSSGIQSGSVSAAAVPPDYNSDNANNDLAILTLSAPAPITANRYELYRASDEIGQTLTLVGYGRPGSGSDGLLADVGTPIRRLAENRVDGTMEQFTASYGQYLNWSPLKGTQLFADFDDGTPMHDATGRLLGLSDLGRGMMEGSITPGDSGGPAFIGNAIAGIATYQFAFAAGSINPDSNPYVSNTYGEFAAWQRASYYTDWIDRTLRTDWLQAPRTPAEVQKFVVEGQSGTTLAWFLVSIPAAAAQTMSVAYRTVDGTAKAGEDYLPLSGRLQFHPGEDHVAVPVEIVGDIRSEGNETFYLEIFDPQGGQFSGGQTVLTAMRTIVDDDSLVQLVGVSPIGVV